MSALGHKQTFGAAIIMSALPPKADMCSAIRDVRLMPKADMGSMNIEWRFSLIRRGQAPELRLKLLAAVPKSA
jgi:hypothetical protein